MIFNDVNNICDRAIIEFSRGNNDSLSIAHTYQKGSNAKAWILSITHNLSIDILRKRKNMLTIDNELIEQEMQITEDEYSHLEVNDILNILDEEEKQIIIFRLYSKLPYKEISKIININVFSLHKKYQRAIKKLKNNYDWRS